MESPKPGPATALPASASWGARGQAALLDAFFGFFLPWVLIALVLFGISTVFSEPGTDGPGEEWVPYIFVGGPLVVGFLYLTILWSRGPSAGMAIAGITLVRSDGGGHPGFARAAARAAITCLLVPWLFVWSIASVAVLSVAVDEPLVLIFLPLALGLTSLPVISYWFARRNDSQTLHDRILGINVVTAGPER